MNCTCTFSPWLQAMLTGAQGGALIMLALILFWWGNRAMRREFFKREGTSLVKALLYNLPATLMLVGALGTVGAVVIIYLKA